MSARDAGVDAAADVQRTSVQTQWVHVSRFGLTNIWFKAGLCALIVGLGGTALLMFHSPVSAASPWRGWTASAGILGGVVLFGIERVVQVVGPLLRA